MKKLLVVLLIIILVGGAVFFFVVPAQVEKGMNVVLNPPPYAASERAQELHRRIPVADFHADSLLWDRNLLERGTRGHVDVPRLIEGNVAVQAFTIVTKTPRNQNIEANDDSTDNITLLAIAERWPFAAWKSLTERALYQAKRLNGFAARSNGKLTVIKSAQDLNQYLERRKGDPEITAGFLGVEGAHALDA
jgi:membrane dipeptidase